MSNTLLIWEFIPEETYLFIIPNEEVEKDDRLELMKMANNKFINNSDWNRGLQFLNEAVLSEDHIDDDEYSDDGCTMMEVDGDWKRVKTHEPSPKEWRCLFAKYKIDCDKLIDFDRLDISRIILSGFIL